LSKKWYVMEPGSSICDVSIKWKPVDDVRFVTFDDHVATAVVRDHTDDRLLYCVHVNRVKCVEVRDE
jgi:hypothetical protein